MAGKVIEVIPILMMGSREAKVVSRIRGLLPHMPQQGNIFHGNWCGDE